MSKPKKTAERPMDFDATAAVMKVASDPTRLRILFHLRDNADLSVQDISQLVGVGSSGVSQHLSGLTKDHMVVGRRQGQFRIYAVTEECRRLLLAVEMAAVRVGD